MWTKPCTLQNVNSKELTDVTCDTVVIRVLETDNLYKMFFRIGRKLNVTVESDMIFDFYYNENKHEIHDHTFTNLKKCVQRLRLHRGTLFANRTKRLNRFLKCKSNSADFEIGKVQEVTTKDAVDRAKDVTEKDNVNRELNCVPRNSMETECQIDTLQYIESFVNRQIEPDRDIPNLYENIKKIYEKYDEKRIDDVAVENKTGDVSKVSEK